MPRVSRAEAESHRQQITEASARLFKERGINGVSVADLMGAAGLTHGGFYGHFESKDALAGVAVAHAFEQSAERWRKRAAGKPDDPGRRAALGLAARRRSKEFGWEPALDAVLHVYAEAIGAN